MDGSSPDMRVHDHGAHFAGACKVAPANAAECSPSKPLANHTLHQSCGISASALRPKGARARLIGNLDFMMMMRVPMHAAQLAAPRQLGILGIMMVTPPTPLHTVHYPFPGQPTSHLMTWHNKPTATSSPFFIGTIQSPAAQTQQRAREPL